VGSKAKTPKKQYKFDEILIHNTDVIVGACRIAVPRRGSYVVGALSIAGNARKTKS
jgi:hypothetical protein